MLAALLTTPRPPAALTRRPAARPAVARRSSIAMLDEADIPAAFKPKPKPPELNLVDREGDSVRFVLDPAGLQVFVGGELFSGAVDVLTYDREDGSVCLEDEDVEGSFQLREEEQTVRATALSVFCGQAGAQWLGDEPVDLPDAVEALLTTDELRESRSGVRLLWAQLLQVYPSEEAALQAVQRNSAIVLPYLNRPYFIEGSWAVLKGMMSEAEALEVVTQNPGVLASNPAGLKTANKAAVQATAKVVDVVDGMWPEGLKWPWKGK